MKTVMKMTLLLKIMVCHTRFLKQFLLPQARNSVLAETNSVLSLDRMVLFLLIEFSTPSKRRKHRI